MPLLPSLNIHSLLLAKIKVNNVTYNLMQEILYYISDIEDIVNLCCLSKKMKKIVMRNIQAIDFNNKGSFVKFDFLRKVYMVQRTKNPKGILLKIVEPQTGINSNHINLFLRMKLKVCNVVLSRHIDLESSLNLINDYIENVLPTKFKFYFHGRYIMYNNGLIKTDLSDITLIDKLDKIPVRGIHIMHSTADDYYTSYIHLIRLGATGITGTCKSVSLLLQRLSMYNPAEYKMVTSLFLVDHKSDQFTMRHINIREIRSLVPHDELKMLAREFPNLETLYIKKRFERKKGKNVLAAYIEAFIKEWNASNVRLF